MNELAAHRSSLHHLARDWIQTLRPRARELTGFDDYFNLRGTEFLLLVVRLARIDELSVRRVFEVGCGVGFTLRLWAEVADLAVGADLPEEIERAERLLAELPPTDSQIRLHGSAGEELSEIDEQFDLIVTQYVMEHVRSIPSVLANISDRLAPGGHAVHVLPNLMDRQDWYVTWRLQSSMATRARWSVGERGLRETARSPFEHTPPHEPNFGSFAQEHAEYRVEKWALKMLEAGFEIVDFFSTRDVNTVLVTRRLEDG